MLTSSTQLQNRSFHVIERTRTSSKCQKMKNARAKRAKILFFILKYANLWGVCCCRRRGCLIKLPFIVIICTNKQIHTMLIAQHESTVFSMKSRDQWPMVKTVIKFNLGLKLKGNKSKITKCILEQFNQTQDKSLELVGQSQQHRM